MRSQKFNVLRITALILAIGVTTARLSAATFDVTTLTDSGPGSLSQAILDANTAPGDDEITFSVTGTIMLTTNLPWIMDNLTITGPGTNNLVINGDKKFRAFYMSGGHTNSVSDLTIANVHSRGSGTQANLDTFWTNACAISSDGTVSVTRCVFKDCFSYYSRGGAIYNQAGNVSIQSSVFTNCGTFNFGNGSAPSIRGGGIYNDGGVLQVANSRFLDCKANENGFAGGGIFNGSTGFASVVNTRFERCGGSGAVSDGGAIASAGTLVINNCVLTNNAGYWGGGLTGSGFLNMTNTLVAGNSAGIGSGIIFSGTGVLSGCTISGNKSGNIPGGAVMNFRKLSLYNCTISQNTGQYAAAIADYYGGARGQTSLNHCTVISNTAPKEIDVQGSFSGANSIIGSIYGPLDSGGHNLIVNISGVTITNDITGNIYNADPMLGPLQNNGGATWTHALLSGSTAIDHGNGGGIPTDQRGAVRSSPSDIGAYELVSVMPPELRIARSAPAQVTLSWLSTPAPLVLQQNTNLSTVVWSDLNIVPANDGTNTSVTLPTDANNKLFRLRSP